MQNSDDNDSLPSKSQLKRDMQALQKIGEALTKLSANELEKMHLPENLANAIQVAKTLKTHEALRRHLQYVGKLMRHVDVENIQIELKKIQNQHVQNKIQFHQIETWREKLILEGDEALQLFAEKYPNSDKQQLRQLIRKAQTERKNLKNRGAETALFRLLRDVIEK